LIIAFSSTQKLLTYAVCSVFSIAVMMQPATGTQTARTQHAQGSTDKILLVRVPMEAERISAALVFSRTDFPGPLAHYAEHLVWLSYRGREARSLDRHSNAWTDKMSIGYSESGNPEDLPEMLRKLAKVFDPIDLPLDFAEQERDILLREYDLRMAGNAGNRASEEMDAFLYAGNPDAFSVIGTPAEILALTVADAKRFHAATHRPEFARLVTIGDVSSVDLSKALETSGFPELVSKSGAIAPPPFELAAPESRSFIYPDAEAAPRIVWRKVVTLPKPVDFELLDLQARLLAQILDTNLPGGLAGPLRFDNMTARSFTIQIWLLDEDNVEIVFNGDPDSGIGFAQLQSAFEVALADVARGIPDETYARVRERFNSYWPDWMDSENVATWMADYTKERVRGLRQPLPEHHLRQRDEQLNKQDVESLLKALAGPGRIAVAYIGKDQKP
jgi:hypothetical protein